LLTAFVALDIQRATGATGTAIPWTEKKALQLLDAELSATVEEDFWSVCLRIQIGVAACCPRANRISPDEIVARVRSSFDGVSRENRFGSDVCPEWLTGRELAKLVGAHLDRVSPSGRSGKGRRTPKAIVADLRARHRRERRLARDRELVRTTLAVQREARGIAHLGQMTNLRRCHVKAAVKSLGDEIVVTTTRGRPRLRLC
jgi:hypothetical protein